MAKVKELVTDILEELIVQADEAPIEASEANAVIRALNNRMTAWAAKGINIGYSIVHDLGDVLTVPDGTLMGIIAQVAIDISPKYDVPASPATVARAKDGLEAILDLSIDIVESEYPSTLPQGSGNTAPGNEDNTFYPDRQDTILEETGGSIALEDDTEAA